MQDQNLKILYEKLKDTVKNPGSINLIDLFDEEARTEILDELK